MKSLSGCNGPLALLIDFCYWDAATVEEFPEMVLMPPFISAEPLLCMLYYCAF